MLLVATQRIRSQVRPQDTTARLGGDEFAVCAPRITVNGLAAMADRLTAALAKPHQLQGQQVHMSASIGTYLATPGENAAQALHQADAAMYRVKSEKNRPQ
jgi:diguanylate cyclase (GGDEF)-like protein